MKTLYESILDDEDEILDHMDEKAVRYWLNNTTNCRFAGRYDNIPKHPESLYKIKRIKDKWIVDVKSDLMIFKDIPADLFEFNTVQKSVDCAYTQITSLKGMPKKVGENFDCCACPNLKSLEGAPKKVGESFLCCDCENLVSLKGAPKKVEIYFDCRNCPKLKSLEGAPKKCKNICSDL